MAAVLTCCTNLKREKKSPICVMVDQGDRQYLIWKGPLRAFAGREFLKIRISYYVTPYMMYWCNLKKDFFYSNLSKRIIKDKWAHISPNAIFSLNIETFLLRVMLLIILTGKYI